MVEELLQANIDALNVGNRINANLTLSEVVTSIETSIKIDSVLYRELYCRLPLMAFELYYKTPYKSYCEDYHKLHR